MRNSSNRKCTVALLALVSVVVTSCRTVEAQPRQETIPEAMARGATGRTATAPSGKSPTIAELLREADIVVRGIVGEPRSYLSEDKLNVYTDYPLVHPVVLFQRKALTSPTPGQHSVTVTQLGGRITVGNLDFTQAEMGLSRLVPGSEGIFILKWNQNKSHIAGTFYGAFGVSNKTVMPLTSKHDFALDYRGAPVDTVLADLTTRLQIVR